MTEPADATPARPCASEAFYAPRPTRATIFLRTFLPWQLWRFAAINIRMLRVIARSHQSH